MIRTILKFNKRPFNEILLKKLQLLQKLSSFIETELLVDVASENIVIEWLSDTAAQIIVTGRDGAQNYFYFNTNAEKENKESIKIVMYWYIPLLTIIFNRSKTTEKRTVLGEIPSQVELYITLFLSFPNRRISRIFE